jgi:hypothetical protein
MGWYGRKILTEGRNGEGFALRTEEGEAEKNFDRRDMKNLRGGRGISSDGITELTEWRRFSAEDSEFSEG